MADVTKIQIESGTYNIKDAVARARLDDAIIRFDTVASLKASTNLSSGMIVKTAGYYSIDDGGSAYYLIRAIGSDTANEMDLIAITNDDTIVAEYLNDKENVNPLIFGAKGDGSTDDSAVLQYTLDYACDHGIPVYIPTPDSFYKITEGLTVPTNSIGIIAEKYDYSGVIRGYGTNYTMLTIEPSIGFYCKNLTLGGNSGNSINGILFEGHVGLNTFEHIRVYDITGYGFKINAIWDSVLTDISIEKCGSSSEYAFSMNGDSDTCNMTHVNRLQVEQAKNKAIYIDDTTLSCTFTNIHSEQLSFVNDSSYAWMFGGSTCSYNGVRIHATDNSGDAKNLAYISGSYTEYNNLRVDSHINVTYQSLDSISIANSKIYSATEKTDQVGMVYFNNIQATIMNITSFTVIDNSTITTCLTGWSVDAYKTLIENSTITTLNSTSTHNHFTLDNCVVTNLITDEVRKAVIRNSDIGGFIKANGNSHDKLSYSDIEMYNTKINSHVGIDTATVILHGCYIDGNFYHQAGNNPYSFVNNVITGTVTGYNTAPTNSPPKLTKTDNLQPDTSDPNGWIYNGTSWIAY